MSYGTNMHRSGTGRIRRIGLLVFALSLLVAGVSGAELQQTVTLEASNSLTRRADGDWSLLGRGEAELGLRSTGNRFAKGELTLRLATSDPSAVTLSVPRAYAKARFPWLAGGYFHITAGKAPLSWGDGLYYNAGDVLFSTVAAGADLTDETIRDNSRWMIAGFFPLGRFAFVEPVVLPEPFGLGAMSANGGANASNDGATDGTEPQATGAYPDLDETSAGIRVQGKLAQVKSELGYLYAGDSAEHRPYLSLQGHLGVDLYGAVSTSLPVSLRDVPESDYAEAALAATEISAGGLYLRHLGADRRVSARLELLVRPDSPWQERAPVDTVYALELYPELVWGVSSSLSVSMRSVVSPIDGSGLLVPGASWNPVDGLSLELFTPVQLGEKSDRFGWDRDGGISLSAIVRYVY
jgi:hypothetical protein